MGALFAGVFGVISACAAVVLLPAGIYLLATSGPLGWLVLAGVPLLLVHKAARWSRKPATSVSLASHFPPGYVSPGGSVGGGRRQSSVRPEPVVPVVPPRAPTRRRRDDDYPERGYFL
jgi:hypothetical protein